MSHSWHNLINEITKQRDYCVTDILTVVLLTQKMVWEIHVISINIQIEPDIAYIKRRIIYGWPLNNAGLNCLDPLTGRHFSIASTIALHNPGLAEYMFCRNYGCREPILIYMQVNPKLVQGSSVVSLISFS